MFASNNLVLWLVIAGCSAQAAQSARENPATHLGDIMKALANQVKNGGVESIEVLYVPPHVMFDTRMTPDRLQNEFWFKIVIQSPVSTLEAASLTSALKQTTLRPFSGPADVRLGVSFKLADKSVHNIYMDGYGRYGQIDKIQAVFGGGLYEWLRRLTANLK